MLKGCKVEARKLTKIFRVLAALKDLSSVPSTYVRWLTTACNPSSRAPEGSDHPGTCMH